VIFFEVSPIFIIRQKELFKKKSMHFSETLQKFFTFASATFSFFYALKKKGFSIFIFNFSRIFFYQ